MRTVTKAVPLASCMAVLLWTAAEARPEPTAEGRSGSAQVIPAWYATARTAPGSAVQLPRVLVMVHGAMHDAVNGARPRYAAYASDLRDRRADADAAAAAAALRVLSGLFPASQVAWDAALAGSLATIPDGPPEDAGVQLGSAAIERGDRLGRRIGRFAFTHALRPLHDIHHGNEGDADAEE